MSTGKRDRHNFSAAPGIYEMNFRKYGCTVFRGYMLAKMSQRKQT